jgi:hypothetical protein
MKKLLSLALIVMVCCTAAFMIGCSSKEGTITVTPPTEGFTLFTGNDADYAEALDAAFAKIAIKVTSEENPDANFEGFLNGAKVKGASIMGFSLKNAGTFTAKVTMYGLTETFQYKVA